jgi:hypothetical protein
VGIKALMDEHHMTYSVPFFGSSVWSVCRQELRHHTKVPALKERSTREGTPNKNKRNLILTIGGFTHMEVQILKVQTFFGEV